MPQPLTKNKLVVQQKRAYTIRGKPIKPDSRWQGYHKSATKKGFVDPSTRRWQQERYPKQAQPFERKYSPPSKMVLSPNQRKAAKKGNPLPMETEDIQYIIKHGKGDAYNIIYTINQYNDTVVPLKVKKVDGRYFPYVLDGRKHVVLVPPNRSAGYRTREQAYDVGLRRLGYSGKRYRRQRETFKTIRKIENRPKETRAVKTRKRSDEKRRIAEWRRTATFRLDRRENVYRLKFKKQPSKNDLERIEKVATYDDKKDIWYVSNTPRHRDWLVQNFGSEKRPIGLLSIEEAQVMAQARRANTDYERRQKIREARKRKSVRIARERKVKRSKRYYKAKSMRSKRWSRMHTNIDRGKRPDVKRELIIDKWQRTGDTSGFVIAEVSNPTTTKEDRERIRNRGTGVTFYN